MPARESSEIRVWDVFVRFAHWAMAAAFAVAYLAEDDALPVHVWAGYTVGALVLLRILWGLVGPRYARFSDFVYAPRAVAGYAFDLMRLRAPRYLGHSPAGGAMVIALLLSLAVTVASGLWVYAEEKAAGPLAPFVAQSASSPNVAATGEAMEGGEEGDGVSDKRKSAWKGVHELFANITLMLVILHVIGVLFASFAHHENLARAMVTGRKRSQ